MSRSQSSSSCGVHAVVWLSVSGTVYQKTVPVGVRDIASGRLFFESSRKISQDATARILLSHVGELGLSAHIRGRVAERKKLGHKRYRIEIELTEFVNVDREELMELILRGGQQHDDQATPIDGQHTPV